MNTKELELVKSAVEEALNSIDAFEGELVHHRKGPKGHAFDKVSESDFKTFLGGRTTEMLKQALEILERESKGE